MIKEVCNRGVACTLKLGSLEKTVIASLLHSGLHSATIFFVEKNDVICDFREKQIMSFFDKKRTKHFYDAKLIF